MWYILVILLILAIILIFSFKKKKKHSKLNITGEFWEILNILNHSNSNVFITGKAGSGKSTISSFCLH